MAMPYTGSGKCGGMVWQRNRYGQICYALFIPLNPRTPAQRAVRNSFGAVSARWRTLTHAQRDAWNIAGSTKKSRYRFGCGPLSGFNYFVKVNVALVNRGERQVALPPGRVQPPQPILSGVFDAGEFARVPVGSTLFLQANERMEDYRAGSCELAAL
jgi:hypothetical protein